MEGHECPKKDYESQGWKFAYSIKMVGNGLYNYIFKKR